MSAAANVIDLHAADGSYDPRSVPTPTPTAEQYGAFEAVFQHFNRELFCGELPPVMLAFAKHGMSLGYYHHDRWHRTTEKDRRVGEIALSPDHLAREERAVASTIVHEMVHHWQYAQGTPSRRGYHNSEWAKKMASLGLMPSSTGEPGGKRTGQRVTHYVIDDGPFDIAFGKLPGRVLLPLVAEAPTSGGAPTKPSDKSKTKYSCAACGLNAWAKPDAGLLHCGLVMTPAVG